MMPTIVRLRARPAWLLVALLAACAEIQMPTDLGEVPPVLAPPSTGVEFTGDIRLGLVPSASEITVAGTDAFAIADGGTGATLITGAAESATIRYVEESTPAKTSWRLLSRPCVSEADADAYIALAQAQGYVTYKQQSGDCWNVYIGDWGLSSALSTLLGFQNTATQKGLATKQDKWVKVTITGSVRGFRIVKGTATVMTPNYVVVRATAGRVSVGDQQVEGVVKVFRNAAGTLSAINEVPLEQYLRRVVPLVLPPDAYNQAEAQKAHAIAERTRALYNVGRHAAEGFDFYPGEFQPYGGAEVEHEVSNAAIDATAGLVAKYDGQLIDTPYHPVSGGWTANSEDVFEPTVPYLRAISESDLPLWLQALTLEVFTRAGATDLRGLRRADDRLWSLFAHWKVEWTRAELAEALSASFGTTVTSVSDVRIVERGTYSRVRRMEFDTDVGTLVAEKNDIRQKLRYRDADGEWRTLSSTLFFVVPVHGQGNEVTGWRLYGAGLGHGVGMSQVGAVTMATNGADYAAILSRYYTGVTIEQR